MSNVLDDGEIQEAKPSEICHPKYITSVITHQNMLLIFEYYECSQ